MKCREYKLPKIGLKVQVERKLRGYSQQDFAKICGLSKSQLCKIELNQYKTMTLETAYQIASKLDMGIDELIDLNQINYSN
ncbi:helix-turn-helix domain-containing protein [Eubacterium aggregans]|uniref:helix-turn-helix domain-containing protein n=1 Tax=Eubacterium aggregans TaxID=81409 RepID=UPI003F3F10F9